MNRTGIHLLLLPIFLMAQLIAVAPCVRADSNNKERHACRGACCEPGVCACDSAPSDSSPEPAPLEPVAGMKLKFSPVLVASVIFVFPTADDAARIAPSVIVRLRPHMPAPLALHGALLL